MMSPSRDVDNYGGTVNELLLIIIQTTFLMCNLSNWYSSVIDWYANFVIDIQMALIDTQLI